ncbi:MAG: hypothetical protein JNL33_04600 [Betaproteobacteria bacterium]|nr:hypothetical protein [Betaproteobacteria bacterium]
MGKHCLVCHGGWRRLSRRARSAASTLAPLWMAAALCLPVPVHAEFVTNGQLKDWLAEAAKRGGSFKDTTLALGFVSAVHDLHAGEEICAPDRMRARDLLQAVREWMRDHPDLWGASGAKTVRRALSDKYPCNMSPDDNTSQ